MATQQRPAISWASICVNGYDWGAIEDIKRKEANGSVNGFSIKAVNGVKLS